MADLIYFLLMCVALFMAVGVSVYALFGGARSEEEQGTPTATDFERGMIRALDRMTRMGE